LGFGLGSVKIGISFMLLNVKKELYFDKNRKFIVKCFFVLKKLKMLIRFVVENFKSFKEETDFNLLTGNVTKHTNHVHHLEQGIDILPISVIYGGNASGKSNLIEAISVARSIIIDGTASKDSSFPVEKYAFHHDFFHKPTKFEFEFKVEKKIYAYGLVISNIEVIEEWLYTINSNKKDKLLFERTGQEITFSDTYKQTQKDKLFLQNEVRGLRKNQPFLTESNHREVGFFDDAYKWFQDLFIIFPEQRFGGLNSFLNQDFLDFTNSILEIGDTGVSVETRAVDYEYLMENNPGIKDFVSNNLGYVTKNNISFEGANGIIYCVYFDKVLKKLAAVKLMAVHPKNDFGEILFEIYQESDGTRRLIDLAGGIYPAIYENRVVIIDEIDRSLHPLLSKKIVEIFLEKRMKNKKTGQLIFTTHEDLIINMDVLRSDEVWLVQKKDNGESELYPLSDFNVDKYNIDVRTGYLNGRFGGIPQIKEKTATR